MEVDLVSSIHSTRVVLPHGVTAATIEISHGRIIGLSTGRVSGALDVGDLVILPGVVDTHVHINEPGRTEWEGFDSATRAAAAGGVTTIVDMPLNSIPATTAVAGFDTKLRAARGRCYVDTGFWGGVVPGNVAELEPLARAGVLGFKCFLSPSGVEEFEHVTERNLREALPIVARLGLPLLVHAELPADLIEPDAKADRRAYATWLASRPAASEHAAIDLLIRLAREYGVHIHVVHLATSVAVPALVAARAAGVPISVETCPHYLSFCAEQIGAGATAYKCAPPIRERRHCDGLWQALTAGDVDLIATDHSPSMPALKRLEDGDFITAWGGIASLQLGLSAVWMAARARGIAIERVAEWMAEAPARLAGLEAKKGSIAPGHDADLIVFDPDAEFIVDPARLYHRHKVTPYAGMKLRGRVHQTILRGAVIHSDGHIDGAPLGNLLLGSSGEV